MKEFFIVRLKISLSNSSNFDIESIQCYKYIYIIYLIIRTWKVSQSIKIFKDGLGRLSTISNVESSPIITTMTFRLYNGHWNNLFRFLITEARSETPRENANAAEALALQDCRFYHMLRIYDRHCHEYTHTSFALLHNFSLSLSLSFLFHLHHHLSLISFSPYHHYKDQRSRSYAIYSSWDYFIKKLKPDRKQTNGFCL